MESIVIPPNYKDQFRGKKITWKEPWMPSTFEMDNLKIKYVCFVQNPGDMVYSSYGAIHWVLNPVSIFFVFIIFFT